MSKLYDDINSTNKQMAEEFQRHDYRAMWEIWERFVKRCREPLIVTKNCKNCGMEVRGLKNAPEIPVHVFTEGRVCSTDTSKLAEYGGKD